jgi:hypothetical protein
MVHASEGNPIEASLFLLNFGLEVINSAVEYAGKISIANE